MAYHCAVNNCSNGGYKLNKWKKELCYTCGSFHGDKICVCEPPFRLYPFPTQKKNSLERQKWKQLINRKGKGQHMWSPSKDSRVCSKHFKDGQPSIEHPRPTEMLGYDRFEDRVKRMNYFGDNSDDQPTFRVYEFSEDPPMEKLQRDFNFPPLFTLLIFMLGLISNYKKSQLRIDSLEAEHSMLRAQLSSLRAKRYVNSILNSDKNLNFFTGLTSKAVFEKFHGLIAPLVSRRWLGVNTTDWKRKYKNEPKRFGPERKLTSRAEFLLTLMRLRLGSLGKDLANRFDISEGLCSRIFKTWLAASAKIFGSLVFIPDEETLIGSKPKKFTHLRDLHSIIDCTEIFIETPKDLYLQSSTWSDYKHHNTLNILVVCAPNSAITYISPAFTGRCSDKALTVECGFLDSIPQHSMIMADKGFNISEECASRLITLYVPPGRRGKSQMTQAAVKKTKTIANHRIIIEQVIRRLKTFRIIGNELPISFIPHIDDIMQVCAGISNLRQPIYK